MTHRWARRADAGTWMRPLRLATIGSVLLALATLYGAGWYQYQQRWTADERQYLKAYVTASAAAAVGLWPRVYALPIGNPPGTKYDNAEASAWLRDHVYRRRSLLAMVWPPLAAAALVLCGGLLLALPYDANRARERRQGRRLAGPVWVEPDDFNAAVKGGGLPLPQTSGPAVRIPRAVEAQHLLAMSDTGAGKSTIIRAILMWVKARGDLAIVVDPAREFLPQFLDVNRGDLVLDALDARCPYWTPGDELAREAEALTVAEGLFQPGAGREEEYFQDWSQKIFAALILHRHPNGQPYSAHEIADIMKSGPMLDKLLVDTGAAWAVDPMAGPQRGGVISSLNRAEHTLRLLPHRHETATTWSAKAWAEDPRGWLFLTSSPETRKAQIPLMTLWLDLLILRLLTPRPNRPRVWIVIDELASMNRIPKLATALTESRKANVSMVLGFQNRGQILEMYKRGIGAAMLSQPATKILLKTTEPDSAEWMSKLVGSVETERVSESRATQIPRLVARARHQESILREVKPLILPSQIQGLPDCTGLLKFQNYVVPLEFDYITLPAVAPAFVERAQPVSSVSVEPLAVLR